MIFLSTCPVRGTTSRTRKFWSLGVFLSTCPVRGTTHSYHGVVQREAISIHVPREGHDRNLQEKSCILRKFLSTCPVRGTTMFPHHMPTDLWNFYPRAP